LTSPSKHAAGGIWPPVRLRDRDATFPPAVDGSFAAQGARVVRTPVRAPRANAVAERWTGTARRDGPDGLLLGPRHLERVLHEDVDHDNHARTPRALHLRPPVPGAPPVAPGGPEVRLDRLGGVLHEDTQRAA
jgi:hypothetical protein